MPSTPAPSPSVEVQVNNKPDTQARYVSWAPSPCRIRQTPSAAAITVTLASTGSTGKVVFYGASAALGSATPTLSVTLPADGSWVAFWMGGAFGSPSVKDGDAAVSVTLPPATTPLLMLRLMVRVRKDANLLTTSERNRFLGAITKLNSATGGLYKLFQEMHTSEKADQNHNGPGFMPWHRAYLLHLERALQQIDGGVTIPYWRFDRPAPNLFSQDFMGVNSNDSPNVVFSSTNSLQLWSTDGVIGVSRLPRFSTDREFPKSMGEVYAEYASDYNSLGRVEVDPHGAVHNAFRIGSLLTSGQAPRDPLFYLLHCNIDRLWAKWQGRLGMYDRNNQNSYSPSYGYKFRAGHNLDDVMWPWCVAAAASQLPASLCATSPGPKPMVGDMLDYQGHMKRDARQGFDYDDVPYA